MTRFCEGQTLKVFQRHQWLTRPTLWVSSTLFPPRNVFCTEKLQHLIIHKHLSEKLPNLQGYFKMQCLNTTLPGWLQKSALAILSSGKEKAIETFRIFLAISTISTTERSLKKMATSLRPIIHGFEWWQEDCFRTNFWSQMVKPYNFKGISKKCSFAIW